MLFSTTFHIFSYQGKDRNISYRKTHISLTLTYLFDLFALAILQKIRIYLIWFLFGMPPDADSYLRHFGVIYD